MVALRHVKADLRHSPPLTASDYFHVGPGVGYVASEVCDVPIVCHHGAGAERSKYKADEHEHNLVEVVHGDKFGRRRV